MRKKRSELEFCCSAQNGGKISMKNTRQGKEQPTEAENLATAIGRNQQCRPLDGPVDRLTLDSHYLMNRREHEHSGCAIIKAPNHLDAQTRC